MVTLVNSVSVLDSCPEFGGQPEMLTGYLLLWRTRFGTELDKGIALHSVGRFVS